MKKMEIETAGASGSWKEMETEMESGSWMEMEMEMELEISAPQTYCQTSSDKRCRADCNGRVQSDPSSDNICLWISDPERETEMESGSWMEMEIEIEIEMEMEMEASEALAASTTNRNVCNPKTPPHRTGLCSLRMRRPCLSRRIFPSPHAPVPVAWTSRCA